MTTFRRTLRHLALASVLGLGLAGCSQDIVTPQSSPTETSHEIASPEALDLTAASGNYELPVDGNQIKKPGRPRVHPLRRDFVMKNLPGATETYWAHFTAQGEFALEYASCHGALVALQAVPMQRGRHVGAGFDFDAPDQFLEVLDALIERHETSMLWFEIQLMLEAYDNDPSSLSPRQIRFVEEDLLPRIAFYEDLQIIRERVQLQTGGLNRGIFKILEAFIDVLVNGEDNRFGDHDEDGTINAKDDDYEGTLWSGGPVTVSGGGDNAEIGVGGCFDPCSVGVPGPGCGGN